MLIYVEFLQSPAMIWEDTIILIEIDILLMCIIILTNKSISIGRCYHYSPYRNVGYGDIA